MVVDVTASPYPIDAASQWYRLTQMVLNGGWGVVGGRDGVLVLRRGDKTREVALDAFYTGQKKNVLQPGEFIEATVLPRPQGGQVFRAHKISKRFEQDISATCAAKGCCAEIAQNDAPNKVSGRVVKTSKGSGNALPSRPSACSASSGNCRSRTTITW